MLARKVRSFWGDVGTVIAWEPLSAALTDTLIRYENGREVWHASHELKPVDGAGPLPSRETARQIARAQALTSLNEIRAQHVADFRKPWPGLEHGKAILGRAIDAAISDLAGES